MHPDATVASMRRPASPVLSMRTQSLLATAARWFAYAAILAACLQGIVTAAAGGATPGLLMRDDGPVETTQLVFVSLASASFAWLAATAGSGRTLFRVLACLGFVAAIRELDNEFLVHGWREGWVWTAMVPLAVAAVAVARSPRVLAEELGEFLGTAAAGLLFAGFVVVVVDAQLFGQKALWIPLLGPDAYRPVKDMVEEVTELVGYVLLAAAAVEAVVARRGAPRG